MCRSDSAVKWEHGDATWLAPGGLHTELRRAIGPASKESFLSSRCVAQRHQTLQGRLLQLIHIGCENLLQSLRDYQPCIILPCWLYCQCVGPTLSSTKNIGFHSFCLLEIARPTCLNLRPKNAQCLDFRLEKTQVWPPGACRLWATTDGEIVIKSLFIVNVAHLLPQSDYFVRFLLLLRWCSDTFTIDYN